MTTMTMVSATVISMARKIVVITRVDAGRQQRSQWIYRDLKGYCFVVAFKLLTSQIATNYSSGFLRRRGAAARHMYRTNRFAGDACGYAPSCAASWSW
jgi:hypothetical protein